MFSFLYLNYKTKLIDITKPKSINFIIYDIKYFHHSHPHRPNSTTIFASTIEWYSAADFAESLAATRCCFNCNRSFPPSTFRIIQFKYQRYTPTNPSRCCSVALILDEVSAVRVLCALHRGWIGSQWISAATNISQMARSRERDVLGNDWKYTVHSGISSIYVSYSCYVCLVVIADLVYHRFGSGVLVRL